MQRFKLLSSILVLLLLLGWSNLAHSQISEGGLPPSFSLGYSTKAVKATYYANVNFTLADLEKEDELNAQRNLPLRVGKIITANINLLEEGEWGQLPNGVRFLRMSIKADEARAVSLYYKEFSIPKGAKLFIYNKNKTQLLGAYTENTNTYGKEFATELVAGDEITLEYVPATSSNAVTTYTRTEDDAKIIISEINYAYNHISIDHNDRMGLSGSCQVNINCSEGNDWQNQKNGIAKVLTPIATERGVFACTGTILNNTSQDLTPYFLWSNHCYIGATKEEINKMVFYFSYEQPDCGNTLTTVNVNTMVGASLLVDLALIGASDGSLLKLNDHIPLDYNVFYNGWDRTNVPATSGVGIHHPRGDTKKISTFTRKAESNTWNSIDGAGAPNAQWVVIYGETTNGHSITEPGSSGSPLFNQIGLVVGNLTGGNSSCDIRYGVNSYGKLWYHWDQGGTEPHMQMKTYLDPANLGVEQLNGKYANNTVFANFSAHKLSAYTYEPIIYTSTSTNAETHHWSFPGGTPSTSTEAVVEVSYSTPGTYNAELIINKGADSEVKRERINYVTITNKNFACERSITIGNGAGVSQFPIGANTYQTFSSSIYTISELEGKGSIAELSWYATSASARTRTLNIYIKEIDDNIQTASTWDNEITGATLVYTSPAIWINNAGWNTVKLGTPFSHSGTKNIKIIVHSLATEDAVLSSANTTYTVASNKHMSWTSTTATLPTANGLVDGNRPNVKIKLSDVCDLVLPVADFYFDHVATFSEDFEAFDFPPENWKVEMLVEGSMDPQPWDEGDIPGKSFSSIDPKSKKSALISRDRSQVADTWLKSPDITIDNKQKLDFYALYSGGWLDKASLSFYITTDNGVTWDEIWTTGDVKNTDLISAWRKQTIDMAGYAGKTVKLAWRYYGTMGDAAGVDGVKIYGVNTSTTIYLNEGESISPQDASTMPVAWRWDFPGGKPASSMLESPESIIYEKGGTYDISLKVINGMGTDTKTITGAVVVKSQTPIANFKVDEGYNRKINNGRFIPPGTELGYINTSTRYPTSFAWKFEGGDPTESQKEFETVTYNTEGEFDFSLKVSNEAGTDELNIPNFVKVGYVSDSIWNIPKGDEGDAVHEMTKDGVSQKITGTNYSLWYYAVAEQFKAPINPGEISEVKIMFEKIPGQNESKIIEVAICDSELGIPGLPLGIKQILVSDIKSSGYTTIKFDEPIGISKGFFVTANIFNTNPYAMGKVCLDCPDIAIKASEMNIAENTAYVFHAPWGFIEYGRWLAYGNIIGLENLSLNIVPTFTYAKLDVDKEVVQKTDNNTAITNATINIETNVSWTVQPSTAWIHISDKTNKSFTINCDKNILEYRKGYVTISGGGLNKIVHVEQSIGSPLSLEATVLNDDDVQLNWSKDFSFSSDIFEDVELHQAFTPNTGKVAWDFFDGDGLFTYGIMANSFPGMGRQMSFIPFDPSQTSPPLNDVNLSARSGSKFLASFSVATFDTKINNNDWIISPKLNFNGEFKFSFWAKTYTTANGTKLERFRVLYSTSESSDFEKLNANEYVETPLAWTYYEYTIPKAAKFVAINCVSNNGFIFMVDDLFIGQGYAPSGTAVTTSASPTAVSSDITRVAPNKPSDQSIIESSKRLAAKGMYSKPSGSPSVSTKAEQEQTPATKFIRWDQGFHNEIGFINDYTFDIGILFDKDDLAKYQNHYLDAVRMILGASAHTITIWRNEVPIHTIVVDMSTVNEPLQYNTIKLPQPLLIDKDMNELKITCQIVQVAGGFGAASDLAVRVEGKGNLVNYGSGWTTMGLDNNDDYNWCIVGVLRRELPSLKISYDVYRNEQKIAFTEETTYTDVNTMSGEMRYNVSATQVINPKLESSLSNTASVFMKYPLTITADDIERYTNTENPDVTEKYTITGFVDNNTTSNLSKLPNVSIDNLIYGRGRDAGVYNDAVVVSGAEDVLNKYKFIYEHGTLTIIELYKASGLRPTEAFSPNGDGIGDYFVIEGLQSDAIDCELFVFDVSGSVHYHVKNYANNWDGVANKGKYKGSKVPVGTYFYILKVKGEKEIKSFIVIKY